MYLSYCGIRVRELDRSLEFYTELFGLREVARGDFTKYGAGIFVLLRDGKSGQKLELNWYPEGSIHATPYTPGEGLDHVAFAVDDVKTTYDELLGKGAKPTNMTPSNTDGRLAYVQDPDGNWIELYPKKTAGAVIPEGY